MNRAIDFYFDFSSPYGYLAAQKIDALAHEQEEARGKARTLAPGAPMRPGFMRW